MTDYLRLPKRIYDLNGFKFTNNKIINQHIPTDAQAELDHGTILNLLVAARLYSPVALSNIPEWAEASGADIFWNFSL